MPKSSGPTFILTFFLFFMSSVAIASQMDISGLEWDGPLPVRQSTSGAVNGEVSWTFEDGTLSLASMSINGHEVDYAWDKDGLPLQIGQQSLSYRTRSYFLSEREVGSARVTYAYSDFGELNDLRVRAGGELFRVRYTRDDLGRITEARETNQGTTTTYTYTYDLLGQVTEVRVNGTLHATYAYDANSNRIGIVSTEQTVTAANITHNGDDQLLQYGDISYTYNAAGQLAQKTLGAELTRYSYGVLGELQRVELPDGRAITYQYDALKRRIGRQVNATSTHRFLWGGGPGPVAEVDANGNSITTFVYGTGINAPDYMVRGAETFALIRDHLGSVRFVLNTANNAIAQELRYDPFGKVILDTNPGFQPFGYAGGLYDTDTELTRFGARDYDAHTARWTARDPIAFGGGQTNLYVYVGNDPINFVDPSGAARVHVALLAALSAAWPAFEFSATMYDVFDFARTMTDSCSTDLDKTLSGGGLLVGIVTFGGGYGVAGKEGLKKLPRFEGPKPKYHVNEAHLPGRRGFNRDKTPLPDDAEEVFKRAVPNHPEDPSAWFGKNANGDIYRFSSSNDGAAHFSGIDGVGDGIRNLTPYARDRLKGL